MRNKALRPPASLEIEHTSTDVTDANVFELAARAASSFDRIGKRTEKRTRFISRRRRAQPCRRRKRFKLAHYLWISHKFKDVKHSAGLCTLATANRHRFKSKKAMLRLILALKWSGICERRAASFFRRKSSRKQEASTPPPRFGIALFFNRNGNDVSNHMSASELCGKSTAFTIESNSNNARQLNNCGTEMRRSWAMTYFSRIS